MNTSCWRELGVTWLNGTGVGLAMKRLQVRPPPSSITTAVARLPRCNDVTTLGKLFTPLCPVINLGGRQKSRLYANVSPFFTVSAAPLSDLLFYVRDIIIRAQRYVNSVLAIARYLSVTSRCFIETSGQIKLVFGMAASFDLSYMCHKEIKLSPELGYN